MKPSATVIVGHPDPTSFNHALSRTIALAWSEAGCEVFFHDLYEEGFDTAITLEEARGSGTTDPLVHRHIERLRASDLLAVVHPNCWGSPPAMVKGWMDRVFAPDAAYAFPKGADDGDRPIGLLTTRAALVVNTGNTPSDRELGHFGDPLDRIWRQCLLEYCGVAMVERRLYGVVATSDYAMRQAWIDDARRIAVSLCSAVTDSDAEDR